LHAVDYIMNQQTTFATLYSKIAVESYM